MQIYIYMVVSGDFPYTSALFGLVIYNDPCSMTNHQTFQAFFWTLDASSNLMPN